MTEENKTKRTPLPCVNNYAVLLRALKDIASGNMDMKEREDALGLSEEAYYEYWLDWAKDKAKEAIAQAEGKP